MKNIAEGFLGRNQPENFRSGFVSIIGRPNVGKSTLLNQLLGQKISITADKPQTTRNQIRGIITKDTFQAVLVDTPGIHVPVNELHKRIVHYAVMSIGDGNLIFYLIEPLQNANKTLKPEDENIASRLKNISTPIILLLNKIDLFSKQEILESIDYFRHLIKVVEIIPISASKGTNMNRLFPIIKKNLPKGNPYYPFDQITDTPEKEIASELIREQIFRKCYKEVPYSVAIEMESFKQEKKLVRIYCSIYVERDSQKGIILGKKGQMLKSIGQGAREKIETMLGSKVYLSLNVKVVKNWSNNKFYLNQLGYTKSDKQLQ